MSTRVLPFGGFMSFNIRMSELRRPLQQPPVPVTQPEAAGTSSQEQAPPGPQGHHHTRAVRRNLFGPVDHEANLKLVQEELSRIAEADARRWNYDFQRDEPLEGRYSWQVPDAASVPLAYNMPNLTKRLAQAAPAPKAAAAAPPKLAPPPAPVTRVGAPATESSLQSALHRVTTASTTVITSVAPITSHAESPPAPSEGSCKPPTEPTEQKPLRPEKPAAASKQTQITDFFKTRKRARSPSDSEGKGGEEAPAPPLLKKTRTTT